ncbi:MAG TPA: hypothetical protein VF608_07100 [Thermoanaerobaculia bacterium]
MTVSIDGQLGFRIQLRSEYNGLPRHWLCRREGMDDEWACGPVGTLQYFGWVSDSGKQYLKNQDGYYLSHHNDGNVYLSYWNNAVPWEIQRDALVSGEQTMRWQPDNPARLTVGPRSGDTVGVSLVHDVPLDLVKHRPLLKAVDANPPFQTLLDPPPKNNYRIPGQTTFFGVTDWSSPTIPVWYQDLDLGGRKFREKLSLTSPGLVPVSFLAFPNHDQSPLLAQVYEHRSESKEPGPAYRYDFNPEPHDHWSQGRPIFRAIPPDELEFALAQSPDGKRAREFAQKWVDERGGAFALLVKGLTAETVTHETAQQMASHFQDVTPIYMGIGAGLHGGYGPGTAGVEFGSVWRSRDFGYVPMHEPITDYATEWVTFGPATGVDLGGSFDFLSIGMWFCETDGIEGACNGVTISAQAILGGSITLFWDGQWQGLNGTSHPIGITTVYAVGLEFGAGLFYNLSATEFFNKRPDFPK